MVPLLQIDQREQVLMQVPSIRQVNHFPPFDVEIRNIDSDLEEETSPSTCPVSIFTSLVSSIPSPEDSEFVLGGSFSQQYFSKINLSPVDSPILTSSPPNSPPHLIPTTPLSQLPQINIHCISTIVSPKFDTPILNSSSSLTFTCFTSPMNISSLNKEIYLLHTETDPLVTTQQQTILPLEVVADFGKYYQSKKD